MSVKGIIKRLYEKSNELNELIIKIERKIDPYIKYKLRQKGISEEDMISFIKALSNEKKKFIDSLKAISMSLREVLGKADILESMKDYSELRKKFKHISIFNPESLKRLSVIEALSELDDDGLLYMPLLFEKPIPLMTVSIHTAGGGALKTMDNALYTVTPYKLRGGPNTIKYMLIIPPYSGIIKNTIDIVAFAEKWRSQAEKAREKIKNWHNESKRFLVKTEEGRLLYVYMPEEPVFIKILPKGLMSFLEEVETLGVEDSYEKYYVKLLIRYPNINYVYEIGVRSKAIYCKLGYFLSTSLKTYRQVVERKIMKPCPHYKSCPLYYIVCKEDVNRFRSKYVTREGYCRYLVFDDKRAKSLRELIRVWPNIKVKITYKSPEKTYIKIFNTIGENVLSLNYHSTLDVKIYVDSVDIVSNILSSTPTIKLRDGIGYKITTKGISIEFNLKYLYKKIKQIIKEKEYVIRYIALKNTLKKYIIRNHGSLDDRDLWSHFFINLRDHASSEYQMYIDEYRKLKEGRDDKIIDEVITYLLNSLKYIILDVTATILGTSPENFVSDVMLDKNEGKAIIIIAENAKGGLGYTETIVSKERHFLEELLKNIYYLLLYEDYSYYKYLSELVSIQELKNLTSDVNLLNKVYNKVIKSYLNNKYISEISKREIKELEQKIRNLIIELHKDLKIQPSIPLDILRYMIDRQYLIEKDITTATRAAIMDILSISHYCWDGCANCILPGYGGLAYYEHTLKMSRSLLKEFVKELVKDINISLDVAIGELGDYLMPLLTSASKEVIASSPWIGIKPLKELAIASILRGFKVTIITEDRPENKEALEFAKNIKNFTLHILPSSEKMLHRKIYLVDDEIIVKTSANLTYGGIYKYEETMAVKIDPKEAKILKEEIKIKI